jgi:cystathionine beta-lyase
MAYPSNDPGEPERPVGSRETRIVHAAAGAGASLPAETVGPAIQKASTVLLPNTAALFDTSKPTYGRQGLASQMALSQAMCELENARFCQLYGSGLAALTGALLSVLKAGDVILVTDGVYQPVRRFCGGLLRRFGVRTIFYPADATPDAILALAPPETRLILIESPASQTFEMTDTPTLTRLARDRGILTLMDNTWAAGFAFRPLDHGVDMSAQALTKYVCGHSDVFLGSVCVNDPALETQLRHTMIDAGFAVTGEDAYQGLRGLRTLPTRFDRHAASALEVARWFQQQPETARVLYPALPEDRFHSLWKRDYDRACGLFGVELNPMSDARVERFLDSLRLFGLGFSWGGFESLATLSRPTRTASPWTGGPLVRFSIGLESPGDLIADLDQALSQTRN